MPGKWLYLEFLIPIRDYTQTLKLKEFGFDWLLPFIFAISLFLLALRNVEYSEGVDSFIGYVLNILGVLFAFSIASITLLITSNSPNVARIQAEIARGRKIGGKPVSVFRLTLATFTFLLLLEAFCILLNFGYSLISSLYENIKIMTWRQFYTIDCFLIVQIFALRAPRKISFLSSLRLK